jgi:hypothetical protein
MGWRTDPHPHKSVFICGSSVCLSFAVSLAAANGHEDLWRYKGTVIL